MGPLDFHDIFLGARGDEGTFSKKQGVKRNEGAIFSCDDGTFFGGDIVWAELNFTPGKINMEPQKWRFQS